MWLVLALALPASADPIEAWSMPDFGNQVPLAGNDGWHNGYPEDTWWGEGGMALPATDHNIGDSSGNEYGSGWAADNWIIRGDDVGQGFTEVQVLNEDDDTIGLVACADGDDSFYLAAHSANSVPPGVDSVNEPTAYLLKVDRGDTVLLGFDRSRLHQGDWNTLSLRINDANLEMMINGRLVVDVEDPDPLPPGQSGFYSYDSGYDGGYGSTNVYFDSISVWWHDEDGDKVTDDEDNCEEVPNPDQADHDDDGLGNECDPDWPPEDTDDPVDDDADRPSLDDDVSAGLLCGCASGGSGAPWLLVLLGAAALRRRRP